MENGINLYVITDHLNAPQMMLDSTGRNIWSATYDAFGKATITGSLKLNLRADGQYEDSETGLYYNWYRYYNPSLGRYITSDPLGLAAGMNTYIYVNGNPINYTDPQGLCPWCAAGAAMGVWFNIVHQVGGFNQLLNFDAWAKVNATDVFLSGLAGGLSGGLGTFAAVKYTTPLANIAVNTIGSGAISGSQQVASNYINNKCLSDGVADSAWNGIKYGLGSAIFGTGVGVMMTPKASPLYEQLLRNGVITSHSQPIIKNWAVGGTVSSNLIANFISNINQ